MRQITILFLLFTFLSCKEKTPLNVQDIVDQSIEVCGGTKYKNSSISFDFRDKTYHSENTEKGKVLKRIFKTDTTKIVDIVKLGKFQRFVNDSIVTVVDTLVNSYANSINSVHYFAYLPYHLNDPAVQKEFLGKVHIKNKRYHKIKVTFEQANGGDDFDDTYVYWFNEKTKKPDYLAYEFHVNGGGMRFREAFNERTVNEIRFVDYNNYQPKKNVKASIFDIDSLFVSEKLELLSKIELKNISVQQDNYN